MSRTKGALVRDVQICSGHREFRELELLEGEE